MVCKTAFLGAALIAACSTAATRAAVVSFDAPVTISGDSDISHPMGSTVVSAISFSGAAVTVNGVSFAALNGGNASSISSGNLTLSVTSATNTNGISDAGNAYTGKSNAPFANLSAGMQQLAEAGVYNDGEQFTITYNGLTPGQEYQFETLVNDSRPLNRSQTVNGGGNTVTLLYSSGSTSPGALGQFAIGHFVADSAQQVISYSSGNSQINATVLESVPEPASLSVLGLGLAGMLARRKRVE